LLSHVLIVLQLLAVYCCLQNVRMWFIMGGVVAALVLFVLLLACGWNFKHC
jgi:hypothetical protein